LGVPANSTRFIIFFTVQRSLCVFRSANPISVASIEHRTATIACSPPPRFGDLYRFHKILARPYSELHWLLFSSVAGHNGRRKSYVSFVKRKAYVKWIVDAFRSILANPGRTKGCCDSPDRRSPVPGSHISPSRCVSNRLRPSFNRAKKIDIPANRKDEKDSSRWMDVRGGDHLQETIELQKRYSERRYRRVRTYGKQLRARR
jgi:hypothetical protein